jgi:hypothetical protein
MRSVMVSLPVLGSLVLTSAALVGGALARDEMPDFDPRPGCAAAVQAGAMKERDLNSCLRSEQDARAKLKTEWKSFATADRTRCADRTQQGGPPSYVEVLTCLEMAKAARELPTKDGTGLSTGLGR